jgi:hypothetical protein
LNDLLADRVEGSSVHLDRRHCTGAEAFNRRRDDAIDEFARTVPITQAGLAAMLIYAVEIVSDSRLADGSMPYPFADNAPIFASMATAAKALRA